SVLYKSILKESPYFGLSVFILFNIFLLPYVFNGMMQAVSASFLLYSTRYFHEKKILRVILITFVASSFHLVGIFIILSYFIYNIKIKKLIYLYIFIIALFISQLNVFEYLFNQYGSMVFPDTIIHRIGLYLNVFDEPINFQRIAQRSLLFFLFYFHFNKLKTLEKFNGMFNIYFMGLIIYLVLSFTELYASRLNMFFRFYEILLIPMVFLVIRPRQRLFYFVFFILWGILILSSNFSKEAYYPFKTWLLQ
ncbi:MAG: EpsG family protein, partial [Candidatus Woesearchaeota archaeon]